MLIYKRVCALLTAIAMWSVLYFPAYAYPAPDLSRQGSITVYMQYQNAPVAGGRMELYLVGEFREDAGAYSFVPAGDFSDCGLELGEFGSDESVSGETAAKLRQYADKSGLTGIAMQIGSDGKAFFGDLEPGMYLLVQKASASGYVNVSPFLVSVPLPEDEGYLYEITASPKLVKKKPGSPGGDGSNPGSDPPSSGGPGDPSGGTPDSSGEEPLQLVNIETEVPLQALLLPQTGQLNWPVPVLAILGMGMFFFGWMLRYGRKKQDEA